MPGQPHPKISCSHLRDGVSSHSSIQGGPPPSESRRSEAAGDVTPAPRRRPRKLPTNPVTRARSRGHRATALPPTTTHAPPGSETPSHTITSGLSAGNPSASAAGDANAGTQLSLESVTSPEARACAAQNLSLVELTSCCRSRIFPSLVLASFTWHLLQTSPPSPASAPGGRYCQIIIGATTLLHFSERIAPSSALQTGRFLNTF